MHSNGYLHADPIDLRGLCEQRPAIKAIKEIANLTRLLRRGLPSNTPLHVRRSLSQIELLVESHWSDLQQALCGHPLPQRKRYCPECETVFFVCQNRPTAAAANGATPQYCPPCASWRQDHGLITEMN